MQKYVCAVHKSLKTQEVTLGKASAAKVSFDQFSGLGMINFNRSRKALALRGRLVAEADGLVAEADGLVAEADGPCRRCDPGQQRFENQVQETNGDTFNQDGAGQARGWLAPSLQCVADPGDAGPLPCGHRGALMQTYILRRLLALLPTLLIASIIVFVIVRMVPGDVVDLMLSQNDAGSNQLTRDQLLATLGLDKPIWEQYGIWISGLLLRGDLGQSLWQNESVVHMIAARLPVTFELGLLAMVIALTVAIPVGVYSAVKQDTAGDYIARSFSLLMLAVPSFWVGTMITVFPSIWWGWSPEIQFTPFLEDPLQNLKQMIIPAIILGLSLSAITMRMTRTMMLEVLRQDYIRTARAKGLGEMLILTRHAVRNALIPVITLIGSQAPILIGGAVILEQIFVLPGMGLLLLDAVNQRDYPVVTGVFFVVGLAVMLINLVVDLSYGLIDPKVRQR